MKGTYHHGDLREALIAEAVKQVREHGVEHVSLRAVAQAVGVSPSAAYHHFDDKEALLSEVCRYALAELDATIGLATATIIGTDRAATSARLRAAFGAYISFAVADTNLFIAAFSPYLPSTPPGEERLQRNQNIKSILEDLVSVQLLDESSYAAVEAVIWATVHGLAMLIVEDRLPAEGIDTYVDTAARLAGFDA